MPLQYATLALLLVAIGLLIENRLRVPGVDIHETVKLFAEEQPSPITVESDPDESRRIVCLIESQLRQFRQGAMVDLPLRFNNSQTARAVKLRFGDTWHVWFQVPSLREYWEGDWILVLVPKLKEGAEAAPVTLSAR